MSSEVGGYPGVGRVLVVIPTYNEADNIRVIVDRLRRSVPAADVLVADDNSPDGTGAIADELAAADPAIHVLHRPGKQGLGAAYRDGFRWALGQPGIRAVVQMDADFSHDPADLPRLLAPLMRDADLVLGTRYIHGGGTIGWPLYRQLISRGGTLFARTVLLLPYHDLTGGFKAWRRELLEAVRLRDANASGYGFQIEMTWWSHRRGAKIVQVPITFRERVAGRSKMSGSIVREALLLVVRLRLGAMLDAIRRR